MNFQSVCVLGLGYIGLPTASTFATHGIRVVGVDVNQGIVDGLVGGQILHLRADCAAWSRMPCKADS